MGTFFQKYLTELEGQGHAKCIIYHYNMIAAYMRARTHKLASKVYDNRQMAHT
jgi:hypothetical protein